MEKKTKTIKKKVIKKAKKKAKTTKKKVKKKVRLTIENFPAPHKDTAFVGYWSSFLKDVEDRDNFHSGHLKNLEILCQLYVEYDSLTYILKETGFSYYATGRYGEQIKTRPESTERGKILAEIRNYARLLGLVLSTGQGNDSDSESDEWN